MLKSNLLREKNKKAQRSVLYLPGLYLKRICLLVLLFLSDYAYYILLFTFPLLIFTATHSIALMGGLLLTVPAGQVAVNYFSARFLHRQDPRFFLIPGFALLFIMIIMADRGFTLTTVTPVMLLWSCGCACIKLGLHLLVKNAGKQLLGSWNFLVKPAQALALLAAPALAADLAFSNNYSDLFSYFGVLIAITALIYLLLFNNLSRESVADTDALPNWKQTGKIFRSPFFTGFIEAYFWIAAPMTLAFIYNRATPMAAILVCLFAPYFILVVLKNIFRMRIWQLKPLFRYLGAGLILLPLFFKPTGIWLFLDVTALGSLYGLIKVADTQERLAVQYYTVMQLCSAAGFTLAILAAVCSLYFFSFTTGLALAGVVILLWGGYLWFRRRGK
jgi:hypothetical protein